MSKLFIESTTLTNIAEAIRDKAGVTTTYTPAEMATAISNISTGTDTSDATATAAQILKDKTIQDKINKELTFKQGKIEDTSKNNIYS